MSDPVYTKAGADGRFATNVSLYNETLRAEEAEGKALQKSANLTDLTNIATARAVLGIAGNAAILDNGDGTWSTAAGGSGMTDNGDGTWSVI